MSAPEAAEAVAAVAARLSVDRERCVGAGQCVLTAPESFTQSEDDGRVLLLAGTGPNAEQARLAVRLCPSGAVALAGDGAGI